MKIVIIILCAAAALLLLPPLHGKPIEKKSLKQQVLSELLQRLIQEQEEAIAQEEAAVESWEQDQNVEQEETIAQEMGSEMEIAEAGNSL